MTFPNNKTQFLVRGIRFLPAVLLCFIPGLLITIPVLIGFIFDPLGALAIAILPSILFFIGAPYATMLVRHRESGIALREHGLYVNVWPFALGTVPYDNIAACHFEDYGVFKCMVLVLKDYAQIGDDVPGVLRLMRSMRANQGKFIRFSNFTFEDDLQDIYVAIMARLTEAASPGAETPGAGTGIAPPDDDQYSCDKRLVASYVILAVALIVPFIVYMRADYILAHGLDVSGVAYFATVVLVSTPLILGSFLRIKNTQPAIILLKQGLYDNAWLYPLGAVPWSHVTRCEITEYRGHNTLIVFLSRPDEMLHQLHWTYRLCRAISSYTTGWKTIQIPQIAVAADLDTLKLEIERRLAAQPGAGAPEAART